MLGTGRGPERQQQMRERVGPKVDAIVTRAQEQGTLRPDIEPADFPILQLMVSAVSDHIGQPDLWRRYLLLGPWSFFMTGAVTPLDGGQVIDRE